MQITAPSPRSRRSRQRAVDHVDRVAEPIHGRERAEAGAFLLAVQHLIEHVEPFERYAWLAVLGLVLSRGVEERRAAADFVDNLLDLLRGAVGRQLRER